MRRPGPKARALRPKRGLMSNAYRPKTRLRSSESKQRSKRKACAVERQPPPPTQHTLLCCGWRNCAHFAIRRNWPMPGSTSVLTSTIKRNLNRPIEFGGRKMRRTIQQFDRRCFLGLAAALAAPRGIAAFQPPDEENSKTGANEHPL